MISLKKGYRIIFPLILAMLVVFQVQAETIKEDAFDRVQRTRTLRCAYAPLSPFINVDPASGNVSGLFHDIMETITQRLNLKLIWAEETGYGQLTAGFMAGRYDAFCGVLWATPARAAGMNFTKPLYLNNVSPCVRGNTTKYDESTDPLNDPDHTLIGYEGDVSLQVARSVFPKANLMTIPDGMPFGEAMQYIITGKADALATCDRIVVDDLNKLSPGSLKVAAPGNPITKVQVALGLPLKDEALKNMLDLAIFDMRADGTLKKLMIQYLGPERVNDTTIIPTE